MDIKTFIKRHPVGNWCKPSPKRRRAALKLGKLDVPVAVDNRAYCTAIEDQGAKPWCAAYTAAAFAENVLWRKTGVITEVEPAPIYAFAKSVDGDPGGDGTTLDCVLDALRHFEVFDGSLCRVRLVENETDLKAAIHRFGCVLGGFDITEEWYDLAKPGVISVSGARHNNPVGGHAVLVCGYDRDGVVVENSWGTKWGADGFGFISWAAFRKQWMYGTVLTNCLNGFK